jgi:hypothetical protein
MSGEIYMILEKHHTSKGFPVETTVVHGQVLYLLELIHCIELKCG